MKYNGSASAIKTTMLVIVNRDEKVYFTVNAWRKKTNLSSEGVRRVVITGLAGIFSNFTTRRLRFFNSYGIRTNKTCFVNRDFFEEVFRNRSSTVA